VQVIYRAEDSLEEDDIVGKRTKKRLNKVGDGLYGEDEESDFNSSVEDRKKRQIDEGTKKPKPDVGVCDEKSEDSEARENAEEMKELAKQHANQ